MNHSGLLWKTTRSLLKSSYIFGEDVKFGGVFRCTQDLNSKFGTNRVFNTPLCEQGIIGFAIGLAAQGNLSIAEIQFTDYILPAFDQIVNEAAKMRYRSGNDFNCGGLTIRTPCSAVGHGGHYHSQSNEAFFANAPGLKMVIPRGPVQAKGLLRAAILDPNPVIVFEPKSLYRRTESEVPIEDYTLQLEKAEIVKPGKHLTVISYGPQVYVVEKAVEEIEREHKDVSIEIIDLQSVAPIDADTITASVRRTGRCVISHEAPLTSGLGAEILSILQEKCFERLEAPIRRVCSYDTPFPLALEPYHLPNRIRVKEAILETLNF
jgi:2-oxoisovalerate dehydrogenase E1 component beta subunit